MKKATTFIFNAVESNPLNSMKKIGYYDSESNSFVEVARWRNSYSHTGVNYGLLQIWCPLYDIHIYEKQRGYDYAGGYNKPIANLESCLYQLDQAIKNRELVSELRSLKYRDCGTIDSLISDLKDHLQAMYKAKLFVIDIM